NARQRDVQVARLETGDDAVEVHGPQLVSQTGLLGDRFPEVDVEARVLAVLLELERHECRIGCHEKLLALRVSQAGRNSQGQSDTGDERLEILLRHVVSLSRV